MNRENKRKQFEKGYYKNHPCDESFTCKACGRLVVPMGAGSDHRNHCPNCLSSLHLDIEPGDREADCGGIMDAVAVWVRKGGEWAVIHRCRRCGWLSSNRVAADDNPVKLMSIAMKPIGNPPPSLLSGWRRSLNDWNNASSRPRKWAAFARPCQIAFESVIFVDFIPKL